MIPVYRIQDPEGRGPFRPGFSHKWVETRPDHDLLKPYFDILDRKSLVDTIRGGYHVGCACLTVEQLRRWFTAGEYITLRGYGFQAVVMMADELLHTDDVQSVIARLKPFNEGAQAIPLYGPTAYRKS